MGASTFGVGAFLFSITIYHTSTEYSIKFYEVKHFAGKEYNCFLHMMIIDYKMQEETMVDELVQSAKDIKMEKK